MFHLIRLVDASMYWLSEAQNDIFQTKYLPYNNIFMIKGLCSNKRYRTQLSRNIYEKDSMWWYIHLRHTTTEKYDNNIIIMQTYLKASNS